MEIRTTSGEDPRPRPMTREELAARQAAEKEEKRLAKERFDSRLEELWGLGSWLSVLAYHDFNPVREKLTERGATACEEITDETNSSAAYAFELNGIAWLVFRGTNDVNDWARNLTCRPRRHIGFEECFEELRPEIEAWLNSRISKNAEVGIAGHSLGGALAFLCAEHLAAQGRSIAVVATFGAPRALPSERAASYDRSSANLGAAPDVNLKQITMRYVDRGEVVCHVPPAIAGFLHVGNRRTLRLNDKPSVLADFWRSLMESPFVGLFARIASFYYKTLKALVIAYPSHDKVQYARQAAGNDPLSLEFDLTPPSALPSEATSPSATRGTAWAAVAIAALLLLVALGAFLASLIWAVKTANWEMLLAVLPAALAVAAIHTLSTREERV